mgnify:CR=1 FL=1
MKCLCCGGEIVRNQHHSPAKHARRKYCSPACYYVSKVKAVPDRYCLCCSALLVQRDGERKGHFAARQYCNYSCSNKGNASLTRKRMRDVSYGIAAEKYVQGVMAELEVAQIAITDHPLIALPPQVRRLWNPITHSYYTAIVRALR